MKFNTVDNSFSISDVIKVMENFFMYTVSREKGHGACAMGRKHTARSAGVRLAMTETKTHLYVLLS